MDDVGLDPFPGVAAIGAALDELGQLASAARHADQLAAVIVDVHAAGFRRLLELADDPSVLTDDPHLCELFWLHEAAGDGVAIATMATRIEALRSSIEQTGVPGLLGAADRLVEALSEMYGWALERAIELLHDSGQSDALRGVIDDALVGALLLSQGMHPDPLGERVAIVVAAVTESLAEHAGTIEVIEASDNDGSVRLKISGGDEKQRWRTRLTVERAIHELVADVVKLEVEGAEPEPRGTPGPAFIPITSIGRRRSTRWAAVPGTADLADGEVAKVDIDGVALVACRVAGEWFVIPDPFTSNTLRLVDVAPPTIEAADGTRVVVSDPLPTHVDNGVLEVLLR